MTKKGKGHAKFSPAIKRLVAQRAGYRCSVRECNKLTIGPAKDPNKANNAGVAAHIYGAALSGKGPRGTGGLSEQELSSSQNAIWVCAHHANLIDKHEGAEYSASALHSYKALHETRVAHELAGIHTPFGWVSKVTVDSSPLFLDRMEIDLAKLNLIVGDNSVGKTALCEWIAGTSDPTCLERWEKMFPDTLRRVSIQVDYFNPDQHCISVDFLSSKYPKYKLDNNSTYVSTKTVKVIFPENIEFNCRGEAPNELEMISSALKLHPYEVRALCDEIGGHSDFFREAWFEESEEGVYMYLKVQIASRIETRSLRLLASSEIERLMMELGIMSANKLSMTGPTLLILDANSWHIDTNWLECYAEFFGSPACKFQTIVSTRSTGINFEDIAWAGWKTTHLTGIPPNVTATTGFSNCIE